MGFSVVLETGARYIEWVNMNHPTTGSWVPLWSERRAVEYYESPANADNVAVTGASRAQGRAMKELSVLLHDRWQAAGAGASSLDQTY